MPGQASLLSVGCVRKGIRHITLPNLLCGCLKKTSTVATLINGSSRKKKNKMLLNTAKIKVFTYVDGTSGTVRQANLLYNRPHSHVFYSFLSISRCRQNNLREKINTCSPLCEKKQIEIQLPPLSKDCH